jgi:hypothetical protein
MSKRLLQPRGDICQFCHLVLSRQSISRQPKRLSKLSSTTRTFSSSLKNYTQIPTNSNPQRNTIPSKPHSSTKLPQNPRETVAALSDAELQTALEKVQISCNELLALKTIPTEGEVLNVLEICKDMAGLLVVEHPPPSTKQSKDGAASALLELDTTNTKKPLPHRTTAAIQKLIQQLSEITYSVVEFKPVFISPAVLKLYVDVQAHLGKPETFPYVFKLYSTKPLAKAGSSPVEYISQNPKSIKNAIEADVAARALQAAIKIKQLAIAMDLVDSSYTTPAFYRAKYVRRGLLPTTAALCVPLAAWSVATQFSTFQTAMDPDMATKVAFAGIVAYVGFSATVGVVAISTANDQMDRVTWASGVPLRQRWMREEERAAIDKIAGAWGFPEPWRRGEEEGQDWDNLREWVGRRSMMLDRVELMEGME